MAGAALGGLAGHECGEVAFDQGLHHRVLGEKVWSRTRPGASARPARPATWWSSCTVRSAARRSPPARPRSASTTPTRVRWGKCQPLATIWVPMIRSTVARLDGVGGGGRGVGAGQRVGGHHQAAGVWEQFCCFLGDAFDAGADGDERVGGTAGGALGRDRDGVAAVVALQGAADAVLDQPGGAVGALHAVATVAAQRQGSVAAAVEEQHGLLAAGQRVADGGDQRGREEVAAVRRGGAQVEGGDRGQRGAAVARGQGDAAVAAGLDVGERLQGGGGGDQDGGGGAEAGADHGHVAGVVDDALLLLEGGLVLLVDDDEA